MCFWGFVGGHSNDKGIMSNQKTITDRDSKAFQ